MEFLTLSELNLLISRTVKQSFPDAYWIMAETSDVRINPSGHCYLEFVEKDPSGNNLMAKARGYIWKNTFQLLKPYFEETTGQAFTSGIKILVKAAVDFHPLYGYGLTVYDIDPSYTLGDRQLQRQKAIKQLEEEGVLDMNKTLSFPVLPQRIAIITSSAAAGYEDFMQHLQHNSSGFVFYTKLFPAVMQGEKTEASVIEALDNIYLFRDRFDVVVIIRGGGSGADLSAFDSYLIAANCAQFPLPVITGIGHERDDTLLDLVAYRKIKTPTGVADFLIESIRETYDQLTELQQSLVIFSERLLKNTAEELKQIISLIPILTASKIEKQHTALQLVEAGLTHQSQAFIHRKENDLNKMETILKLSSPHYILSKGYSMTVKNEKIIKSASELIPGDKITTRFSDGDIISIVE